MVAPRYAGEVFSFDYQLAAAQDGSLIVRREQTYFRLRDNGTIDQDFGLVLLRGEFIDATAATGAAGGRLLALNGHALQAVQTADGTKTAGFAFVVNRTLFINGDDGRDSIYVGNTFSRDDTTATNTVYYDVSVNGIGRRILVGAIDRAVINLHGGDDTLDVRSRLPRGVRIAGGDGNDTLDVAADKPTIFGGDGDDVIRSGLGSIYSWGDSLIDGEAGDDYIQSNASGHATIYGGSGNDSLTGGPNTDLLFGNAGNDRLDAGPGADTLDGGSGLDIGDDDESDTRVSIETIL